MNLRDFLNQNEPESLEKLAQEHGEEFLEKVLPIIEKTANYTAHLVMEKLAEALGVEQVNPETTPDAPVTGSRDNTENDGNTVKKGLDMKQVHDAIYQAIEAGQPDKIMPFIQAISQNYPDIVNTVIQAAKVEIHDGIMRKKITDQDGVQIAQSLNSLVEA
jgi:hypothetical protein